MGSLGFIFNSYCPINYPNIHQFHRVSCFKVALDKEKLTAASIIQFTYHYIHECCFLNYWVRLANQTKLFCSNEILHLKTFQGNFRSWPSLAFINIGWTYTLVVGCSKAVFKTSHCNYRKQDFFIRKVANGLLELK